MGRRCPHRAIRRRSPKGAAELVIGAGAGLCCALRQDGGGAIGEVDAVLAHAHGLWRRGEIEGAQAARTRVAAA